MESELDALATSIIPSIWLRDLLHDLIDFDDTVPITVFQDNQGTISHCTNEQTSNRTAHLRRRYHFIHQYIELGWIKLQHLPGTDMVADQLTKSLPRSEHEKHCKQFMSLVNSTKNPFTVHVKVYELATKLSNTIQENKSGDPTEDTGECYASSKSKADSFSFKDCLKLAIAILMLCIKFKLPSIDPLMHKSFLIPFLQNLKVI